MIVRLLAAALCAASFTVPSAAAQSALSDPYQAAQRSWQCRSVVPGSDVIFDTDPWRRQPPAPANYMTWSNALASQAAWAVLYGYSLWTIDREHRHPVIAASNERALVSACRAEIGALPGAAQTAVQSEYSQRWRAVRDANLARQNAPTTDPALMRKEAEWCVEAFEFGLSALDVSPRLYFEIDVNAPGGAERWERFRSAFDDQWAWWTQRAAQLASRRDAAAPRVEQESLILQIQALFEHSGLGISEIGVVQGHFAKQETNFCAAKANALRQRSTP